MFITSSPSLGIADGIINLWGIKLKFFLSYGRTDLYSFSQCSTGYCLRLTLQPCH